jgi:hypothetical protein
MHQTKGWSNSSLSLGSGSVISVNPLIPFPDRLSGVSSALGEKSKFLAFIVRSPWRVAMRLFLNSLMQSKDPLPYSREENPARGIQTAKKPVDPMIHRRLRALHRFSIAEMLTVKILESRTIIE